MQALGAEELGETLNADFTLFVRGYESVPSLLRQALSRLDEVEGRLQALEEP